MVRKNNLSSFSRLSISGDDDSEIMTGQESIMEKQEIHGDLEKLGLDIHPLPDGVIISVHPPKAPSKDIRHVPCDITLVIDVSGSMCEEAPVPTENPSEKERNGLTVLDLTKHAALTILETLNKDDRLGIVTFSDDATIIQTLLPMTPNNKAITRAKIAGLKPDGLTNLWHGILKGIEVSNKNINPNSASAIMVLTDGMPNQSCPKQGYVPKLRKYEFHSSIHTFGFGYAIRSGLLKSIAEVGGGNYAFIPDAGMIGTVFVHAIANLQSTFARSATLKISTTEGLLIAETMGDYAQKDNSTTPELRRQPKSQLSIPLGNLQYGQSRDIFLKYGNSILIDRIAPMIQAEIQCQTLDESTNALSESCSIIDIASMSPDLISYNRSRSMICSFISTLAPLASDEEHRPISAARELPNKQKELETLIKELPAVHFQDELNKSLVEDLAGQIRLSLAEKYFDQWGKHFLLSIHGAHTQQLCNSFKDPGPLQYGKDSPLFIKCRDELDHVFDTLPPPKPSVTIKDHSGNVQRTIVSMKRYHNKSGPCFAAQCQVKLGNGTRIPVSTLEEGIEVWTPKGARKVAAVVATKVIDRDMCKIGDLVVTPWHPVCIGQKWTFPNDVAESFVLYTGVIYSLLLEPDEDHGAHGVEVGGYVATTFGHGVTYAELENDVRAHAFFGDYGRVAMSIKSLPKVEGVHKCGGVERSEKNGLICGFIG